MALDQREDNRASGLGLFCVLSDELICEILELLSAEDIGKLACVSRVFNIFCNEEPLWMKLCMQNLDGLLKYVGSWKGTVLERLGKKNIPKLTNVKLQFSGFSSMYLYRRWYRCNIDLSNFVVNVHMLDRRHDLSMKEFSATYCTKQPLLLSGLADNWPAMHKWSIDYLIKHYGECIFKVAQENGKKVLMNFEDYAFYMSQQHDEEPLYIFDPKFGEVAPGLAEDYEVPWLFREDLFDFMDKTERPPFRWLVIGPPRSGASWHVDPALTSAWNTLIKGRKRWALYPPGRVPPSVIVHADEDDGEVDVDSPTSLQWWLDVYPALRNEDKPLECIQYPGETIYVPSGWWHCVLNLDNSLAVTQNFVNTSNFQLVSLDLCPGYQHKAVARAGRLALQEHISAVSTDAISNAAVMVAKLNFQESESSFDVDFLARLVDHNKIYLVSNSVRSNFHLSQLLRKWLHNLWCFKRDLKDQIWKIACIAFNAKGLLQSVISICDAHNLPRPTEQEQLPLGNGSNPVFIVGSHVIKLYLDEAIEDKAIDAVASELQFYSIVKKSGSPLEQTIPRLVASGVVYNKEPYRVVTWDGRGEPNCKIRGKIVSESEDYLRARWNQAVLNSSYLDCHEDDVSAKGNAQCPYIITMKCEGQDFAHMREKLQKDHILYMAQVLGEHLYNLHDLPLPQMSQLDGKEGKHIGSQQNIDMVNNHDVRNHKVPEEWILFYQKLCGQHEHAIDRLEQWGCVPLHLIKQVEGYLTKDPISLVAVNKLLDLATPVWLHMDINDENLQIVLAQSDESVQQTCSQLDTVHGESSHDLKSCYILDFGDVCLGDPVYDLVSVYLDVFRGNSDIMKHFLKSYYRTFSLKYPEQLRHSKYILKLSYRAMCYTILHEENALGAVFSIWKELKTARTWQEVEQRVWGFLAGYEDLWNQMH
ncbi:hypothetical protein KP509_27G069900 [Ceratopteris richardii]|uniref:JmjC domain-containing protein n=1 Tax=Ceratopteris richardii TaxID=49495 RepID=A0A8T2RIW9_CERRI|nr:hypothetical protein KP509_27G069900 [Ceratopteris richardii]